MKKYFKKIYCRFIEYISVIKNEYNSNIPKIYGGETKLMISSYNFVFTFTILFANLSNYINYLNPPSGNDE